MSPCFVFHSFVCFHTVVGISQFDYETSYFLSLEQALFYGREDEPLQDCHQPQ